MNEVDATDQGREKGQDDMDSDGGQYAEVSVKSEAREPVGKAEIQGDVGEQETEHGGFPKTGDDGNTREGSVSSVIFGDGQERPGEHGSGTHFDIEAPPTIILAEGDVFFAKDLPHGREPVLTTRAILTPEGLCGAAKGGFVRFFGNDDFGQ